MHNINDLIVSKWGAQMMGYKFPCSIGRGGIGIKTQEGDGITPSGTWEIEFVMARQDRLRYSTNHKINIRDTWSDDPKDPSGECSNSVTPPRDLWLQCYSRVNT